MVLFLLGLPHLSKLVLDNSKNAPPFSSIFIDALHSHAGSADLEAFLLPNLKLVHYAGPIMLDTDGFLAMINERYTNARTAAKLKVVLIHSYDQVVEKILDLPQVQMLWAQGLVVDIQ